jgi:ornithine cyclodeaminase/alanine dehydrogenase-like protein (mu-crystallin family)
MRELILFKNNIREDEDNITLFKSVGTALEDLAAAELVIEKI